MAISKKPETIYHNGQPDGIRSTRRNLSTMTLYVSDRETDCKKTAEGRTMLEIGRQRELFLDEFLLDKEKTTAARVLHHPVRRELIMTNDAPWEADGWVYYTVFEDQGLYRMYYLSMPMYNREHTRHDPPFHHINYAESRDGIHWIKPELNIWEFQGSKKNNIVMITDTMDAFHVFRDTNPACPKEQGYKAVYTKPGPELWCMASEDGLHFKEGWRIGEKGHFDSYNSAFYDAEKGIYCCYFRDFHDGIRDIRYMTSSDFRNWSEPVRVQYTHCTRDYQMYTNHVQPYFRAPQIYIAFPTRYTDRGEWTENYDALCGSEHRKWRMQFNPRFGTALTDCLLMSSRDGNSFYRYGEAFLAPGPESRKRWIYGDSYLAYGMLATPGAVWGEDRELSFYSVNNCWTDEPAQVFRYTLRMDGFVSMQGDSDGKQVVTEVLTFEGNELTINFSTSAAGSVYVKILDEDENPINGFESTEIFGDSTDRRITFGAELSAIAGKPVRLCFTLFDADLYSFKFN